jgi:hypothetical protein
MDVQPCHRGDRGHQLSTKPSSFDYFDQSRRLAIRYDFGEVSFHYIFMSSAQADLEHLGCIA